MSCAAKTINCGSRAEVQARLHLPPDQHLTHPESGICRALYDCPDLALSPIAQNPAGS
jgi:hypothetical protein